MNKKELYEENRKLKQILKSYSKFWETDAIEEISKELDFTKKSIYRISIVLIIISVFLIGLALWGEIEWRNLKNITYVIDVLKN